MCSRELHRQYINRGQHHIARCTWLKNVICFYWLHGNQVIDHNVIREGVTIHRGTVQDRSETTIGNHNLLMAYVHVGHDSVIGNHCILVNNVALAGHVWVDDWAILSGYTLVHQFCRIGAHSFSGMGTAIGKDVPAYVMVYGSPAEAKNINAEGLRRRGFSKEAVTAITRAYKTIYRRGLTLDEALQELEPMVAATPELQLLIDRMYWVLRLP